MANPELQVKIGASITNLEKSLAKAQRSLDKFSEKSKAIGRQMQKTGLTMSKSITAPLAILAGFSVKAWDKQEKAIAQVEAGLRSVGGAVGYTSGELQKMANDLQNTSLFGDEEILKDVTAQLLTFTNIANKQFARTQQAALDLATRLDGDLKSASIQLGKALNDPVANLSALSRSGIQFSTEQKTVIKSLVETNRLADAQTIILDELEKQYGGSATAAAKAGAGPLKQLSNTISDLNEQFGAIIGEALLPFIEKMKGVVKRLQSMSPEMKKIVVVVGLVVAALGPLLTALGFLMTTVVPGLITVFGFLSGTVLPAVIAGFKSLTAAMLANPIGAIIAAVGALLYAFTTMLQKLTGATSKLKTFFNIFKSLGDPMKFTELQMLDQVEAMLEVERVSEQAEKEAAELAATEKRLAEQAAATTTALLAQASAGDKVAKSLAKVVKGTKQTGFKEIGKGGDVSFGGLGKGGIKPVTDADIDNTRPSQVVVDEVTNIQQALLDFNTAANDIINGGIANTFLGLGEAIGQGLANGANVIDVIGQSIIASLGGVLVQFGKLVVAAGIASEAFSKAMKNPFGGGVAAIIAGTALIAIGTAVKSFSSGLGGSGSSGSVTGDTGGSGRGSFSGSSVGSSGGFSGGNVVFEIQGTKLVGVLTNTLNRNKALGGGTLTIN